MLEKVDKEAENHSVGFKKDSWVYSLCILTLMAHKLVDKCPGYDIMLRKMCFLMIVAGLKEDAVS